MTEPVPAARCLACNQEVLLGLDVCVACGGRPMVQAADRGEYAVEAGPIPSAVHRQEASELIAQLLAGVDAHRVSEAVADARVRLCEGLDRETAEAFAARLGRQQTSAAVTTGRLAAPGIVGGFSRPWPWLAPILGVLLGLLTPLSLLGGLVLGIAAAFGLAAALGRDVPRVLGQARFPELLHAPLVPVARKAAAAVRGLTGAPRQDLARAGKAVCELIDGLRREGLLDMAEGGVRGARGQAAIRVLEKAVAAAELVQAAGGTPEGKNAERTLAGLADAAERAMAEAGAFCRALSGGQNAPLPAAREDEAGERQGAEGGRVRE